MMQAVIAGLRCQHMVCKHDGGPRKTRTSGVFTGAHESSVAASAQLLESALAVEKTCVWRDGARQRLAGGGRAHKDGVAAGAYAHEDAHAAQDVVERQEAKLDARHVRHHPQTRHFGQPACDQLLTTSSMDRQSLLACSLHKLQCDCLLQHMQWAAVTHIQHKDGEVFLMWVVCCTTVDVLVTGCPPHSELPEHRSDTNENAAYPAATARLRPVPRTKITS